MWRDPTKRLVASAAALVGVYSCSLGLLNMLFGGMHPHTVGILTILGNSALCVCLYWMLAALDGCLARALVYSFLTNALCPSSSILFEWAHAPSAGGDLRCLSANECAAQSLAGGAISGGGIGGGGISGGGIRRLLANQSGQEDESLPCGWAHARGYPCISPIFFSWTNVAGSLALAVGSMLFTAKFQAWSYKRILCCTQLALVLVNFLDLAWVWRLNLKVEPPPPQP